MQVLRQLQNDACRWTPISMGIMLQDPPQLRETADKTERCIYRDIM